MFMKNSIWYVTDMKSSFINVGFLQWRRLAFGARNLVSDNNKLSLQEHVHELLGIIS